MSQKKRKSGAEIHPLDGADPEISREDDEVLSRSGALGRDGTSV